MSNNLRLDSSKLKEDFDRAVNDCQEFAKAGEMVSHRPIVRPDIDGTWTVEYRFQRVPGGYLGALVLDTQKEFVPFVQEVA